MDEPVVDDTLTEDEKILAAIDTDFNPLPPDGNKQKIPDQQAINDRLNDDLNPPIHKEEPKEEAAEEEEDAATALLKAHKLEEYESLDDVLKDFASSREKVQVLSELMKKAKIDVSDDPLQDLNDMIEQNMSGNTSLITGARPAAQTTDGGGQDTGTRSASTSQTQDSRRSGDGTRRFLDQYKAMNWTEDVLKDLATALGEHLTLPEAPKTDGFVLREEVEPLATMNRRLFEQTLVSDHIISRMAAGDKLPANYRSQLNEAIQKNQQPMERALRGFAIRGRAFDVMTDYAKGIPSSRDDKTGLDKGAANAMADETARLIRSKRTLKGGDAPSGKQGKREPSLRDLEFEIEKMGRKII